MNRALRHHSPKGPVLHLPTPETAKMYSFHRIKQRAVVTLLSLAAAASAFIAAWGFISAAHVR